MISIDFLPQDKKIFFISDFHLGAPNHPASLEREKKIIRWLESIRYEAHSIFILGDIFDFWFEYKYTIPKGFIRLQGKLAELSDEGLPIYIFTGNHDMWMFDYFKQEMNIPVFREPLELKVAQKNFLVGHGDGLGPGDYGYKFIKKVFANKICQWLFGALPPVIGMGIAQQWSKHSRISSNKDTIFLGDKEFILQYCRETEKTYHHDYYIFGHRHLPLDLEVSGNSRYVNLGEWVNYFTYAVYNGTKLELKKFES